jgi:hypothetical protein
MNPILPFARKCMGWLLLGAGVAASGSALAQTYNIFLKAPGSSTPTACATGGFTFTKTTAGSFTVNATINTDNSAGCPLQPNSTYSGPLNVIVENVTIGGQDQGPNVVGLSGTLPITAGGNTQVTFSYVAGSASTATPGRPAVYTAPNSTTSSGAYHVANANSVPEPSAIWLVLPALVGLLGVQARRKRG